MKKIIKIILLLVSFNAFGQREFTQELGLNLAGVFIKNQATVAPALLYRLHYTNYAFRFQISIDGNLNNKNRNGTFTQDGGFGNFSQDTLLDYDPGKQVRFGLMAGFQKNKQIDGTSLSWYYGLDFFYMMSEYSLNGKGTVATGGGSFDTTKTRIAIKVSNKNKLSSIGVGMPLGITYRFGKRFYTSLEAKFVIAFQKVSEYSLNESVQNFSGQELVTKNEGKTENNGFDFGIKPITGLCVGMFF